MIATTFAPSPRWLKGATRATGEARMHAAASNANESGLRVLLWGAACGLHGRNSWVVSDGGSY